MNGDETVSLFKANSHHTTNVVYSFKNNDLFAIMTFKERKDQNQVKQIYGRDILTEPLPKPVRLGDISDEYVIRNNKTFMKNNFENVIEIN